MTPSANDQISASATIAAGTSHSRCQRREPRQADAPANASRPNPTTSTTPPTTVVALRPVFTA